MKRPKALIQIMQSAQKLRNKCDFSFLVVDDHRSTRDLVHSILYREGYTTIQTVKNGLEAVERLDSSNIDVVICDWKMPEMSGLELLKEVRSSRNGVGSDMPFIMLTAQRDRDEVVLAFSAGVSDYVVKPFTSETLINKVKNQIYIINSQDGAVDDREYLFF